MDGHLSLLGFKVRDVVTGRTGVVTSISFDLSGCVQGAVNPEVDKDGKLPDPMWFDTKRLVAVSDRPVMISSSFVDVPGGQVLPQHASLPAKA